MSQYRAALLFAKLPHNRKEYHSVEEQNACPQVAEIVEDIHEAENHDAQISQNIIDVYVKEIQKYPLLSKEDERRYLALAQNGDIPARDELIHANLRLALRIARRYQRTGIPLLDLLAEGNFGLIHAIKKFDMALDHRFSTYAAWWVQHYIETYLLNQARLIRIPIHIQKKLSKARKAEHELSQKKQREITTAEISEALGINKSDLDWFKILHEPIATLSPSVSEDYDDHSQHLIESQIIQQHSDHHQDVKTDHLIPRLLNTLSELEQEVVALRVGLRSEPLFFHEIGSQLNIPKNKARNVYEKALSKLSQTARSIRFQ